MFKQCNFINDIIESIINLKKKAVDVIHTFQICTLSNNYKVYYFLSLSYMYLSMLLLSLKKNNYIIV